MNAQPPAATRDGAAVRVPPPLVPIVAVVSGIALDRWWPIDPGLAHLAPALDVVGSVLIGGSILLVITCIVILQRSGQDANPWKPTPSIVDHGPFAVSRNPIYLAMVLFCLGFGVQRANLWILALTPLTWWILHRFAVVPEEAYLSRKFGRTYDDYRRRVRRWL